MKIVRSRTKLKQFGDLIIIVEQAKKEKALLSDGESGAERRSKRSKIELNLSSDRTGFGSNNVHFVVFKGKFTFTTLMFLIITETFRI